MGSASSPQTAAEAQPIAPLDMAALVFSVAGFALCCLLGFGLMALPLLPPSWYAPVGGHDLDSLALIVGVPGPLPAALGVILGLIGLRAARRHGEPQRWSRAAIALGAIALAPAVAGFIVNALEASGRV